LGGANTNPKNMDSWVWKCILKNRQQFEKGVRWEVGNGININFWLDNGCVSDSLANLLKVTNRSLINTSLNVSHFITRDKQWDIARLESLVDPAHLHLILTIPIPVNAFHDSVCWGLLENGEFFTKSVTWVAYEINLVHAPVWEYNWT